MQEEVALLFGLIAFLFHAMMDIDLQVPALIATAGAITLLVAMPVEQESESSKPPRRILACFVALAVAAGAILGGWHLFSSEYVFSKLTETCALSGKTPEQVMKTSPYEVKEKLEAALKARPYSPFPYSTAGAFYMGTRRLDRAEFCYKKALKLAPDCAAYYFRLFLIQDIQGRKKEAIENLRKACELFPNNPKYKLVKEAFINNGK